MSYISLFNIGTFDLVVDVYQVYLLRTKKKQFSDFCAAAKKVRVKLALFFDWVLDACDEGLGDSVSTR